MGESDGEEKEIKLDFMSKPDGLPSPADLANHTGLYTAIPLAIWKLWVQVVEDVFEISGMRV